MVVWQFWFMIGSGIYLLLLGTLIIIKQQQKINKTIGIYNVVIGIISLVCAFIAKTNPSKGNIIFNLFCGLIVISFIIFTVLKKSTNQNN